MKKIIFVLSIVSVFSSCTSNGDKSSFDLDKMSKCFISMNYEYEKFLPKSDLEKYIKIEESSFKTDISKKSEGGYGWVLYEWKSDRQDLEQSINGTKFNYPDKNSVKFYNMNFYDAGDLKTYKQDSFISLFEIGFKVMSEEEFKELYNNLEKKFANDPKGLQTAKDLLETRKKQTFQHVDGIGDSAYWKWHESHGLQLNVLAGNTKFELAVRSSGTSDESLKLAVKLAEGILAKCK